MLSHSNEISHSERKHQISLKNNKEHDFKPVRAQLVSADAFGTGHNLFKNRKHKLAVNFSFYSFVYKRVRKMLGLMISLTFAYIIEKMLQRAVNVSSL